MAEIKIPFRPEFKDRMSNGRKLCTSRPKRYGFIGDTFHAFSCTFQILALEKIPLKWVSAYLYYAEGFDSPLQFEKEWCKIHPGAGWRPEQLVWVHYFRRI